MDNNETRKMILKPAKTSLKKPEQKNGSSAAENGHSFSFGNNPFLKCDKEPETDAVKETSNKEEAGTTKESNPNDLFKPAKPSNLFTNSTTTIGFVFGQNLHERVVTDKVSTSTENHKDEKETPNLFSNALFSNSSAVDASSNKTTKDEEDDSSVSTQPIPAKSSLKDPSSSGDSNGSNGEVPQLTTTTVPTVTVTSSSSNLSLVEAARKYEEMKGAQKRKYEEVEVITGEEDEENILEINCKLYTFENSNYEERGRGTLRLNDTKNSSRVVFRAAGSYRVLLNTKVWRDQLCEKPSSKSMRLTAFNSDGLLKIYLVQGRNEDIENLFYELNRRIEKEKSKAEDKSKSCEEQPDEEQTNKIEPAPKKKLSSTDDE